MSRKNSLFRIFLFFFTGCFDSWMDFHAVSFDDFLRPSHVLSQLLPKHLDFGFCVKFLFNHASTGESGASDRIRTYMFPD